MRKSLLLILVCCAIVWTQSSAVRPPGVAGTFYPADPKELAQMVDGFLAQATPAPEPNLVAIVSPHAGYQFSGHVAAWSYSLIKGRKYSRVVVIAPSHYDAFNFVSVYDGAAYSTPLGRVPVDQAFAKKLAAANSSIKLSSRGHQSGGQQSEHALEDQLPFLQRTLGDFQLVPIVMGDQDYSMCRALGLALASLIKDSSTLIVASSDLSHYHTYEEAERKDHKTLKAIEEWDYLSMSRNFPQDIWEACGGGPIIAAMIASERLGAHRAKVLKYANSGDVTSDHSRVVGYGAVAFVKEPARHTELDAPFRVNDPDRAELLRIARTSVETAVREHKLYQFDLPASETLAQERGAFVTLKKRGDLRGCIGYVAPMKPLAYTVRDVAAYAAVEDRRFQPVSPAELPELQYEISVLSPMHRVLDIFQIQPGRDGLLMKRGDTEGLLLPQVAAEEGWDRDTFLRETCFKAGLETACWSTRDTDIFSFTALVFGEPKKQSMLGSH
jgi:hypothetical protein